ncbi:MAG: alpha-glucan family phosphorylase [Acidobacteriota bacterium]
MNSLRIPTLQIADIELPREVARLGDLAYNLWWTWSPEARQLFSSIDGETWARYRSPIQLLINVDASRWESLVSSSTFMAKYGAVVQEFDRYMNELDNTWFHRRFPDHGKDVVAYFSMEYGVHSSLAVYSGGLGVLSGDHCKSASDLGLPFIAVGLMYRHGYFQQTIDAEGLQQHSYPEYDFSRLPIRPALTPNGRPLTVEVPLLDRSIFAKVWTAQVGRVPLLLLDTDVPRNDPADRPITDLLYVQGREMRLIQEMVVGIGGVKALEELGVKPSVWHINEGHCAFLQLERLRRRLGSGQSWGEAFEDVRRSTVFTTHTPVTAGNEQFDRDLAGRYLQPWGETLGQSTETLLDLGAEREGLNHPNLNLTALALRTSCHANGVSQLNGEVADRMWRHLFPHVSESEPVISGITNGVHTGTWIGTETRSLLERHLGRRWPELLSDPGNAWEQIRAIPDRELWEVHLAQKARLGRFTLSRTREQLSRHGASPGQLRRAAELYDPNTLTIGFARRFATYKRANLVFSDLDRFRRLITAIDQPVQLFFAGKAHPADRPGQELIQRIFELTRDSSLEGKVFFIENYDMRVGAMLVQGVDIWLNNPRKPLEASGTSGQKAAMNGVLNFSILDGWWPEGYDGLNGWAIDPGQDHGDAGAQDAADAAALYDLLEFEIKPLYYQRDGEGLPTGWVRRMKDAMATIIPRFSANRMVRDYVERAYLPTVRSHGAVLSSS